MKEFCEPFKETVKKAETIDRIEMPVESPTVCDKYGKKMVVKMGRFSKFLACPVFLNVKYQAILRGSRS